MTRLAARFPQISLEYLLQNGGTARARNRSALQSQADFVAFLDADDAYEQGVLAASYMALEKFACLSLVRLKCRPVGFPAHYLTHGRSAEAWRRLKMTVGGNMVVRRSIFLACGGFPQDSLFRRFGGEDVALGIALTRNSVVGPLFCEHDAAVWHVYCRGIHAEKLLDSVLYGKSPADLNEAHMLEAEAVTERICRRLAEVKAHSTFGQTGIMPLTPTYE